MLTAVFVDCTPALRRVISDRRLPLPGAVHVHDANPGLDELIHMCADKDVLFVEHTVVPPELFDACPKLRTVIFMGTGAGTYVDLDDAKRRGVAVHTVPGYGDRAVAEHALALLLSAARGVARMDREIRRGVWHPADGLQIQGRKLAVIGMGGIGTCFADMAIALGMKVAGWNRTARDHPAYVGDLNEALRDADAVSLHLGLNAGTRHMLDSRLLELPRKGFILVNTARAELIEEATLLAMLDAGRIGHAALDVFPEEPLPASNPYEGRDDVTLTAHAAYMTDDAYEALWRRTLSTFEKLGSGT